MALAPSPPRLFTFVGAAAGAWRVDRVSPVPTPPRPPRAPARHRQQRALYTPADAGAFEDLVGQLRASPEWRFVEREVDLRLTR